MALYTYDEEADALYILIASDDEETVIGKTVELAENLHVDLAPDGSVVGVEILYPTHGPVDLEPIRATYGLDLHLPFNFAA